MAHAHKPTWLPPMYNSADVSYITYTLKGMKVRDADHNVHEKLESEIEVFLTDGTSLHKKYDHDDFPNYLDDWRYIVQTYKF